SSMSWPLGAGADGAAAPRRARRTATAPAMTAVWSNVRRSIMRRAYGIARDHGQHRKRARAVTTRRCSFGPPPARMIDRLGQTRGDDDTIPSGDVQPQAQTVR